jgi:hypothetical protein
MKKAIVTFANNEERYIKAQARQEESLKKVGWDGDYFAFKTFEEIGSPDHDDVPYAFKPFAIDKVREMGYDLIIWMDSPVYAIKPLDTLCSFIENNGSIFFDNLGFTIGDYTSDECLRLCDMTREEAFNRPMIMACLMGFDFTNPKTSELFDKYLLAASEQGKYEGDWHNNNLQVSKDNRVKGHRHDQSVMSILMSKRGIKPVHPHSTFFAYFNNPGHLPHAETVCLLSHGL